MSSRRSVRIGELGRVVTGKTPPSLQPELFDGTVPFITPSDMSDDRRYLKTERHVSSAWDPKRRQLLPPDAVCVVCIGATIGKVCMSSQPSHTNQQINSIIVETASFDARFVYYSLRLKVDELKARAAGAATPIINKSAFSEVEIEAPDLETQRRIASTLGAYDDLIEVNRRRVALLEGMARGLFEEWFVRFRFPGHERQSHSASHRAEVPFGWELRALGTLLSIDKGVSYNGAGLTPDGNPMVNLKNIRAGGGFRRDATKPYSGKFKPRHTVKPGDVVLANTDLTQAGSVVASPALVPTLGDDKPILISHHLYAVRPYPGIAKAFVYHLMLNERFRSFARGFAIGTTVLGLPKEGVLNYSFVCPPTALINDFAMRVSAMHEVIETYHNQIDNLSRTRDLLLPRLISGQLSVGAAKDQLGDAA